MPARKKVKKNRPVPCTDANQKVRERLAEKKRQRDAIIKKVAEMRAKEMLARQQRKAVTGDAGDSSTISALAPSEDVQ